MTQRTTNGFFAEKTASGLNVFKIVDVCISHITPGDVALLEADCSADQCAAVVYRKECGFFVHLSHEKLDAYEEGIRKSGYSDAFLKVLVDATETGAAWICFDGDAAESEQIPTFEHR